MGSSQDCTVAEPQVSEVSQRLSSNELEIKLASPTVVGPAMQILPLAIYI
jgi:hypothetical protein